MTRQRQTEKLLKTFGKKKMKRFNNIYIHGVGMMSPHRHIHARRSHIMVCNKTAKTAHIKAKKHTHRHTHPHIYTVLCMHAHKLTQRDRFTLSAHFFGISIRLKTHMDLSQYY